MTHYSLNIERVTPEIRKALEQLKTYAGVTIVPTTEAKAMSKWDEAIAEGAVTLEEFDQMFTDAIQKAYSAG